MPEDFGAILGCSQLSATLWKSINAMGILKRHGENMKENNGTLQDGPRGLGIIWMLSNSMEFL